MATESQCRACGKKFSIPDTHAGKKGKCPCGAMIDVPAAPSVPPPSSKALRQWLAKIELEGKIKLIPVSTVRVNILDPMGGLTADQFEDPGEFLEALVRPRENHRTEDWVIGLQLTEEQYRRSVDPQSGELYVLITYEAGKPRRLLIQRGL